MLTLRAEPAGFVFDVHGNLLPAAVEDPHQPRVPTHPDLAAEVLGRHRVVGPRYLDVAVTVHAAPALVEERQSAKRQRSQGCLLDLGEQLAYLPARRAVDA